MKSTGKIIRKCIILILLVLAENSYSSPQLPDYIVFKGDTIPIYTLLLEQYFSTTAKSEPEESLFGLKFREGGSLNCWRGYQAIYSIENDSLFLNHIIHCGELRNNTINKKASTLRINEIFGDNVINNKVFLDWFSGEISLPNGELLRWDGVFHKIFETEILIEVNSGIIKSVTDIKNYIDYPNRISRKYGDTISNIVFAELQKVKWKNIDKFDCSESYLITIGKNGKIDNVSMLGYQTKEEIKEAWDRNEYRYCIRTIKRSLRKLEFDIIKMNGKPIEETILIEIWIEEDGIIENWTY